MFKRILKSYFLAILTIFCVEITAQTEQQWVAKAQDANEKGDFLAAAHYYLNAYQLNDTRLEYYFNYGEALRKENLYEQAFEVFASIVEKDKLKTIPEAYFWMAVMAKQKGNYQEAKTYFSIFNKQYRSAGPTYKRRSKNEEVACEVAQKIMLDTAEVVLEPLDTSVNSHLADFGPRFLKEYNLLTFNALAYKAVQKDNQISEGERANVVSVYTSLYDTLSKKWNPKVLYHPLVNNDAYDNANLCMSKDGKRLYFSRCSQGNCSIFVSEFKNNEWGIPAALSTPINVEGYSSTQPFVAEANGREVLFFASNKPGGKGGFDLYYSEISGAGKKYNTPKNLGRTINTVEDELTPFYDSKLSCLYFSSDWHHGLGGQDIFKSCGPISSLPVPENMGIPFNSSSNDLYFSIYEDSLGFFSSNRKRITEKGDTITCCSDLYSFVKKPVQNLDSSDGKMIYKTLEQLNKYLPVTLYFHNDQPNPKTNDTLTSLNYLSTYTDYTALIDQYKEQYSSGLEGAEAGKNAQQEMEDFFFNYVDKGVSDLGMFMHLLEKAVLQGGRYQITIKGYASPLAQSDYNERLTLRRISSLINYMTAYKNGLLAPYLESEAIIFTKIPFGEYKADTEVSDNLNDQRNSVYSIKAAKERKIEVLSVAIQEKSPEPLPKVSLVVDSVVDLGKLKYGQMYYKTFTVKNEGNREIVIYEIESDCSCTVVDAKEIKLVPGASVDIPFKFTATKKGEVIRKMNIQYVSDFGKLQQFTIINVKASIY